MQFFPEFGKMKILLLCLIIGTLAALAAARPLPPVHPE
jgi:hypothetical protein